MKKSALVSDVDDVVLCLNEKNRSQDSLNARRYVVQTIATENGLPLAKALLNQLTTEHRAATHQSNMRRFPLHRLCETFSIISAILQQFGVCSKNNGPSVLTTPDAEDTFDQLCEISYDLRSDVERTGMDFEYWYAVGSVGPLTGRTLFKLEQLLYTSIEEEKLWCTYIYPIEQVEGSEVLQRGFERLGVVTFTPGASDEPTECKFVWRLPWRFFLRSQ